MKKLLKKARQRYLRATVVGTVALMMAGSANAANNARDVFSNIGNQFDGFGVIAIRVFAAVGIVLVGMGIWGISTRKDNPQKPISHSIWFIVGGALLMALAVIIRIVLGSTIQATPAGLSTIGIN